MPEQYIGFKLVEACPALGGPRIRVCGTTCHPGGDHCNGYCEGRADHAELLDQQMGYAVRYPDGYPDGYQSWSPKGVFEAAYRPTSAMCFGGALAMLKAGHRVARAGWNGKGMWLSLSCNTGGSAAAGSREIAAENFWSSNNSEYARQNGGSAVVLPCITMKTATGEILMGWLASQTDMLVEDWCVVTD